MAKDSDKRAGSLKKPDTGGGVLTGFLAEEEHLDRRALLRLGTWGVASVGAVIIAVLANQSSMKLRHDEVAAMDIARQSQQIQSIAKESQNETRRLASAIDTLDSDRDRLYARVTVLEQGLDSVTGSIARQSAAAASSLVATPAPPHSPSPSPQPVAQSPAPAPVTAPVATAAPAAAPEKPQANAKPTEPAATTVASATPPAPANALQAATSGITPAPQPAPVPLMASKSMIGPPDPAASKPVEPKPAEPQEPAKAAVATPAPVPAPIVVASAPPDEKKTTEAAKETVKETARKASDAALPTLPQIAVKRTEFGVDVGGANSVGGLRALWRGLLKSRSNAPLAALQPIIMIKEGNNGLGMQLRLVAGPLSDAAAAARICAAIAEHERPCETTVFDGQRLAMTAEDASAEDGSAKSDSSKSESIKPDTDKPAAAKPVSGRQYYYHHRSYPKKPAPVAEAPPPPPKPEPTTLSSFFSRRQP